MKLARYLQANILNLTWKMFRLSSKYFKEIYLCSKYPREPDIVSDMAIGHYVPQLHLRYFSSNPKECGKKRPSCRINCFDKKDGKLFGSAIGKIGGQRNFYILEDDAKEDFEKFLQKHEDNSVNVYKRICDLKDTNRLRREEKKQLATLLALQDLRTLNTRETLAHNSRKLYTLPPSTPLPQNDMGRYVQQSALESFSYLKSGLQELLKNLDKGQDKILNVINSIENDLIKGQYPAFLHGRQVGTEEVKEMHLQHIMRSVNYIVSQILKMKWIVLINSTNKPFWTSDNPLVNLLFHDVNLPTIGREIQMFFPLNAKTGIGFASPNTCKDTKSRPISEGDVLLLNRLQVMQSERYIFSDTNNLQDVYQFLIIEPNLRQPYRDRYGPFSDIHLDSKSSI